MSNVSSLRGTPGLRGATGNIRNRNEALRALQSSGHTLLYAVRTKDGLIKIGVSANVVERFLGIDGGVDEVLALQPGTRADELEIHHSLIPHRARGREYYHPAPEVIAVVNELRDEFGLPHIAA